MQTDAPTPPKLAEILLDYTVPPKLNMVMFTANVTLRNYTLRNL